MSLDEKLIDGTKDNPLTKTAGLCAVGLTLGSSFYGFCHANDINFDESALNFYLGCMLAGAGVSAGYYGGRITYLSNIICKTSESVSKGVLVGAGTAMGLSAIFGTIGYGAGYLVGAISR